MLKVNLLSRAMIIAASLCVAGEVLAGAREMQFQNSSEITKASEWMGKAVKDREGNDIGKVADFAINAQTGQIAYAVVSTGGLLSKEHIAVPVTDLQLQSPGDKTLRLEVSQSEWKQAQQFSSDNWPLRATVMEHAVAGTTTMTPGTMSHQDMQQKSIDRTQDTRNDMEFSQLDTNGDGYLSAQELQAKADLAAKQKTLDANHDGQISRTEFAAFERTQMNPGTRTENPEQGAKARTDSADEPY